MRTLIIIFTMARSKCCNKNMEENIPLEDLSLDDEEDDKEDSMPEKTCHNLLNKKLAKVLVKKNYDEYKDGWGIDLTGFSRLSECRMHKMVGPLIKEAEKESRKRRKQKKKKNMSKKAKK